jgi:mercuric ion transport protein
VREAPTSGPKTGAAVGAATVGVGAALAATAASVCCTGPVVAPLVVALLGASGAATAAGLKPYAPYLFAASFVTLGFAFWTTYRRQARCDVGVASMRTSQKIVRVVLWSSALIWLGSLAYTIVSNNI